MDRGVRCVRCGVVNSWHEGLCQSCGCPLGGGATLPGASASMVRAGMTVERRSVQLRWVVGGTFVMLAVSTVVCGAILGIAGPGLLSGGDLEREDPEAVAGLAVALGAGLLASFFVGGVFVGRLSHGRTIVEPALAACLSAGVLLGVSGALARGLTAMLCVAPVLALLAMAGGWLGEKWQGPGQSAEHS